jgi:hypothetical protein
MAEDIISAKALQIEPELGRRKVEFLRRTDKSCGDLSGIVPLVKQMPVFLTQHVDRDPERNLLKGRRGFVEDWILDKEEVERPYSKGSCADQAASVRDSILP